MWMFNKKLLQKHFSERAQIVSKNVIILVMEMMMVMVVINNQKQQKNGPMCGLEQCDCVSQAPYMCINNFAPFHQKSSHPVVLPLCQTVPRANPNPILSHIFSITMDSKRGF